MLRRANAMGARYCFVLGESEIERGVVQVKDLAQHSQEELPLDGAAKTIASRTTGEA